jgi:hypothetical protein
MGWRSTGAAFRAGNYSGPLTSDEGGFAAGFAKTFTAGISKAADIITEDMKADREQEREQDLIRLRETLAAQRAAATASRTRETEDTETLTAARSLAESLGMADDASFVTYAASVISANDGDVSQARTAIQRDVNSGLVVLNPATSTDPGGTVPPASSPDVSVPEVTPPSANPVPDPASMDDLEATELTPTPAVFRPDEDQAEVTPVQATTEPPAEDNLGVSTAPPAQSRFRLDFDAPLRTEVASMSTDDLLANIRIERGAGSPNTRRLELMQSALLAKREEQFMTLTDDQLMSYAASEDQEARTLAGRVLESRMNIREQIAEDPENLIAGLETPSQVASRRLSVAQDPDIPQGQKDALLQILDGHMEFLLNLEDRRTNAEAAAERPFDFYAPLDGNGRVSSGGADMRRLRMNSDGQLEDQSGRVVEGNWMPIIGEDIEGTVKFNNTRIDEIVEPMISASTTVRDLVDLRDIISASPSVTNRFATTVEGIRGLVNEGLTVINSITSEGREYTLSELEQVILGQNLSRAAQEVAMLQLRIAYGLAAMDGSSGQALSDRELQANLNSIFQQGDPRNAVNTINRNIQRVMETSETRRSTRVGSMVTFGQGGAAMFSDAIWQTPMSDFVPQQLGEGRMASFEAALAGEIPEFNVQTQGLPDVGGDGTEALTTEELFESYMMGEPITVTPELAERYPNLQNRIGQTIRRATSE